ncbi:MAG: hypothetical protein IAE83_11990 [Anaerolinea sp.]|nr:hypothetical protein [Anaerolinea sp.]MCC6975989.1 hypothetical protein [Anaerolineae bacterium]CAG0987875.1 hypothetical protein ANRL4_02280 [Anaerolineae bacterium]
MSDRNDSELFDFSDFDDFDETPRSDDEMPVNGGLPPRRNTRFLVLTGLLLLLILVGIVIILLVAVEEGRIRRDRQQTITAIEATNAEVARALTLTMIAKSFTPTPTSTPTETFTPTPTFTFTPSDTPSPTPTETVTPSPTEDMSGTLTKIAIDNLIATLTLGPDALLGTANAQATLFAAMTLTAGAPTLDPTSVELTRIALESTTVGTPNTPTLTVTAGTPPPTTVGIGVITPLGPTREGGTPFQRPTTTAVPDTGFFDDIGVGSASPSNLPLFALAALGLVGVIFIVRRMRVQR